MPSTINDQIQKYVPAIARKILYASQPVVALLAGLEQIWDVVPADAEPKIAATWLAITGFLGALAFTQTRD